MTSSTKRFKIFCLFRISKSAYELFKVTYLHNVYSFSYSSMTRILKRYKLNYHMTSKDPTPAPGVSVDFSGYPGSITSQDEFYVLRGEKHRMAVTGTTLRNYNSKLWRNVNITEQVGHYYYRCHR